MANRDLTNFREVTQVVAKQPSTLVADVAKVGTQLIDASEKTRIAENLSAVQADLNKLNYDFRIKNESDPFNSKAVQDYKKARQDLFGAYGKNISSFYEGDFQANVAKLSDASDDQMQDWGYKQSGKNAISSFNKTIDTTLQQIGLSGKEYAASDDVDILPYLNFEENKQKLTEIGNEYLGEATTAEALAPMDSDAMKIFVASVAEVNPKKAADLLARPDIQEKFSTEERLDFAAVITKTEKLKDLQQQMGQVNNSDSVFELVNDPNIDYYNKRLTIDTMEFNEEITPKMAKEARRVLTSQKNLDAVTDTPIIADIITRMYDLNAIQEVDSSGYLKGVQNLKEEIVGRQASGELSPVDANKLNNRLTTLTTAKMSDATQRVGLDFYDANEKFLVLPPEYRGKATRELFYKTDGKDNVSQESLNLYTTDIITRINFERRTNALKKMDEVVSGVDYIDEVPELEMLPVPQFQEDAGLPTFSSPDDAGFAALPSGAQFMDEQGITRTKR